MTGRAWGYEARATWYYVCVLTNGNLNHQNPQQHKHTQTHTRIHTHTHTHTNTHTHRVSGAIPTCHGLDKQEDDLTNNWSLAHTVDKNTDAICAGVAFMHGTVFRSAVCLAHLCKFCAYYYWILLLIMAKITLECHLWVCVDCMASQFQILDDGQAKMQPRADTLSGITSPAYCKHLLLKYLMYTLQSLGCICGALIHATI